jgi:hypothetical protein
VYIEGNASVIRIVNNVFGGPGEVLSGGGDLLNNVLAGRADFVDTPTLNYGLRAGAAAIGRGIKPGPRQWHGSSPTVEYAHKAKNRTRSTDGTFDVGAFHYGDSR